MGREEDGNPRSLDSARSQHPGLGGRGPGQPMPKLTPYHSLKTPFLTGHLPRAAHLQSDICLTGKWASPGVLGSLDPA